MTDECGEDTDCDCACINGHLDYYTAACSVDQDDINALNDELTLAQSQLSEDSMWMMYWINRQYICNCAAPGAAMAVATDDASQPARPVPLIPLEKIRAMAERATAMNSRLKDLHQRHLEAKAELKSLKEAAKAKQDSPPDLKQNA